MSNKLKFFFFFKKRIEPWLGSSLVFSSACSMEVIIHLLKFEPSSFTKNKFCSPGDELVHNITWYIPWHTTTSEVQMWGWGGCSWSTEIFAIDDYSKHQLRVWQLPLSKCDVFEQSCFHWTVLKFTNEFGNEEHG